jgi:hypothetical protein
MSNSDLQQRKRDLRLRIGRMRRRINNRLNATRREGRRLLSWREYVVRYPSYAILAAFGVGLAASGGFKLKRGRLLRFFGLQIMRQTAGHAGQHLWREIQRIWAQSGGKP